jgi:hypothetical protein
MFTDVLDEPAVSIFTADQVLSPAPGMNFPFSYIHIILLSRLAYFSTLKMEEAEYSVTLVSVYQITLRLIPDDHKNRHSKNFKSHIKTRVIKWASDQGPSSHIAQTMSPSS